ARADRDLDAVLALFAEAATVAERAPGGGPDELYRWVNELQITDAGRAPRRVNDESVSILTAHASKGLEWEIVCLAGVQDGVWPNLRQRGSLLGADLLVDVAENRAPISSGLPGQRLAEERRLFYVACTRAKRALYVTALAGADTQPSRFIDELDPLDSPAAGSIANEPRVVQGGRRAFALRSVVAELRAALLAPEIDERDRAVAAAELARLAAAGVDGAHPDDWWGLAPLSTEAGIRPAEAGPVPIRPSKFEAYRDCELRALLSELGAVDASDEVAASLGTLVHSVAELAPPDATEAELTRLLEDGWPRLEFAAPWHAVSERARAQRMVAELASWLRSSRSELTELGREVPFQVSAGDAQLSGKVDRLERDQAGRLVVVDLKTTKSKPTQREVADHAQLAAYQFAVSEGGFTDGTPTPAGGARLLQLGSPTRGEQAQPALSEFSDPSWVGRELARIASVLRGNTVTARPGADCKRCPARLSCPAQNDGRQVTS
ncbi:MAG: ATP-dependent helicase, partial [Frankiales bacterium]|nr:ATP-dependent helicase [Frankiales bacterium]